MVGDDELAIGNEATVTVVSGKYIGSVGIIAGSTPKMYYVEILESKTKVRLLKSSVEPLFHESQPQENVCSSSWHNTITSPPKEIWTRGTYQSSPNNCYRNKPQIIDCNIAISETVNIVHGKYAGKVGIVTGFTAKMVYVQLQESTVDPVRILKSNISSYYLDAQSDNHKQVQPLEMDVVSMPDAVGGMRIETMRLAPPGKVIPRDRTFAGYHFKHRLLSCEIPMGSSKVTHEPMYTTRIVHNGRNYELLCSKLQKEKSGGYAMSMNSSKFSLHFVRCDDNGWLQKNLEELADFAALPSHKVASRLELFQTPAMKSKIKARELLILDDLSSEDFDCIPENCNEGCGFVPRGIITRLLGNSTKGKRTIAIQVRIFAPKLGIFKGMLVERRGITNIQLPPSMLKVGPSRSPNASDTAIMIVKGIFPGETTLQVGRVLNPLRVKPPPVSFQHEARLKLSHMITDLWESLGVPNSMIQSYKRSLKDVIEIRHSYLVGVADPTGIIPEGHIFVPGLGVAQGHLDTLFVTRCPCMVQEDGKLLPVLRSKPTGTDQLDWDFLNSFAFGAIIFGNSRPGFQALPTTIANGDLDGDLYFLCWHKEIVEHIEALPFALNKIMPVVVEVEEANVVRHSDWLSRAQDIACDLGAAADLNHLVGTLYNLSKKFARDSQVGAHDPAAVAFGKAYQASLDLKKHGGQVSLPSHLWTHLPPQLHKYVQ